MKLLLSIIYFTIFISKAYAQSTLPDLKSGKYLANKHKDNIIGNWKSISEKYPMELEIKSIKRDVKKGDIDFTTDFFIVTIKKLIYAGKDVANQFIKPIEVIGLSTDDTIRSLYIDPITGNKVEIKIKYLDKKTIQLLSEFPEMGLGVDRKKGTVFPQTLITLTRSGNSIN